MGSIYKYYIVIDTEYGNELQLVKAIDKPGAIDAAARAWSYGDEDRAGLVDEGVVIELPREQTGPLAGLFAEDGSLR